MYHQLKQKSKLQIITKIYEPHFKALQGLLLYLRAKINYTYVLVDDMSHSRRQQRSDVITN